MKRDKSVPFKKFLGLLAVCLIAVVLANFVFESIRPKYDRPPAVMIDGSYYQGSGGSTEELPPDSVYLGEIASSVPSHKSPTKDFQANDELTGAPVYRVTSDKICVQSPRTGQWLNYYKREG